MRLPPAVLPLLLASALLAGCAAPGAAPGCEEPPRAQTATPMVDGKYMQTAPGVPWQTVVLGPQPAAHVHGTNNDPAAAGTAAWSGSPGWSANVTLLSAPGTGSLHVATVQPGPSAGNATVAFEEAREHAGCTAIERVSITWDLAAPESGRTARAGQGTHVMTAGFLTNGTLFYTNIPEIDSDDRWPRVPWYSWEGDAPLPVYVYDHDRTEQPAYWKAPSALVLPVAPKTGNPTVDGAVVDTAYSIDATSGAGYFTTIPGFNAGLKQAPTTTLHVVSMPADQGYTRAGNEAHPLYGEPLVFLIKVLDVVDAPCPATADERACALG